ncbi:probable E3 ubiquitin-protein ligase HERC4 isoform X2 [Betta splendens]|uniref:Probable E3 ubiquitin-protein ligase HERC4 isoform X2 n=1 Tax=Betta splendens TaxID=158456 RepID=A0A6P7MUZ2_BETSP|nr:probable E3 ubiquitin-protein ligase HERC4 isoform X2 [Betta splendens]
MFTWGEECQRGFCPKGGSGAASAGSNAGVHHLNLSYHIRDLAAGHNVLVFLKPNGNSFIIRTHESEDGIRVRRRQKFVKCKEKIQAVSCGDEAVTLLSDKGCVLCVEAALPPRPLEGLHNIVVSQVACGSQHSLALTKDGRVYTWGQGSRGQLGLGTRRLGASPPQHLRALSGIPLVQIAAGGEQSFCLSVSGAVFSWGRNHRGQLGLGDTTDRDEPVAVHYLDMKKTVSVSCGEDHTVALTKDGAVFTFGSGRHGQLGHNSFRNELRPRLVAELWGSKVIQVACGRRHTLALTDSRTVYSFGSCEQGQLGRGEDTHPSVPLPVHLPLDGDNSPIIRRVFAGGNCSFATVETHGELNTDTAASGTRLCLEDMIDHWTSNCDSKSRRKKKLDIRRMFSSACCVNQSFLEQRKDKHFQTSPTYHGLNLSMARLAFKKLVQKEDVVTEVEEAVLLLLQSLNTKPLAVEGLRLHLLLTELLHVIQKHGRRHSERLPEALAAAVLRLPAGSLQVLGEWWASLPASTMVSYVRLWKKALSALLASDLFPSDSRVRNLLGILQHMYNVNRKLTEPRRVPDTHFCLWFDTEFLKKELLLWHMGVSEESLILLNFPILMDLQTKKRLFDLNAEFCKMTQAFWFHSTLELYLSRGKVLKDTLHQLSAAHHSDYKKSLIVYFDEVLQEDDISVNVKDFFHKVFHEMTSVEAGMFMFNDSETLAWFPSNAALEHQTYFLLGLLCGLALYHQCIVHLPFPLVLFKKLLGIKPSLEDMMEFSPCVGGNLKHILEKYDDDIIKSLEIDFSIDWDGKKVELDPENPEKPVTGQNKREFVEAYVNYAFNTSVAGVFQEFKQGFFQVCDQDLVKLFGPEELQGVLVGDDFHDWAKMKENTIYEGEYQADHPTIKMFWEVFEELTEHQKKTFLWFVTGFERVSVFTMKNITVAVRGKEAEEDSYDQYYPETHTCFSKLELPLYSSKDMMRSKLTEALSKKRI